MFDRERAERDLKAHLNPKRYEHSVGVAKKAGELAVLYGADVAKAELAGLFHDFTKYLPDEESLAILKELGEDCPLLYQVPHLAHGYTAAFVLKRDYGLDDEEVLSAIRNHTFGGAKLSLLDKIVFLADAIEDGRIYKGVDYIRTLANVDLHLAIAFFVKDNCLFLLEQNREIHPAALEMYHEGLDLLRCLAQAEGDLERYKELRAEL